MNTGSDFQAKFCVWPDPLAYPEAVSKTDTAPTTPNQIVAWNVAYFRKAAGWTQDEFAARLFRAGYGDAPMSTAAVSAAERSSDGKRVRQFDADLIVCMARVLGVPVPAFFLPPTTGPSAGLRLVPAMDGPACVDGPAMVAYRDRIESVVETTAPRRQSSHKGMLSEDHLAARIRYEMTRRGWSQDRMAREMGKAGCHVHQSSISKIVNAQDGMKRRTISVDEAIGFAKVFAVPIENLLLPLEAALDGVAHAAHAEIAELTSEREATDKRIAELRTQVEQIKALGLPA